MSPLYLQNEYPPSHSLYFIGPEQTKWLFEAGANTHIRGQENSNWPILYVYHISLMWLSNTCGEDKQWRQDTLHFDTDKLYSNTSVR